MRWWQNISLKRKLLLIILLTSSATLLLACTLFMFGSWFSIRRSLTKDLTVAADIVAKNSTAALAFNDPDNGRETLQAIRAQPHIIVVCLFDKDARLFTSFTQGGTSAVLPAAPGPDGTRFEPNRLIIVRPVLLNDKRIGTIYVESGLGILYERLRIYGVIALGVLIVAFLLSSAISVFLQQTISKPILTLAETARHVAESRDYSVRAEEHGTDEIARLTGTFNQMLSAIQARDNTVRQAYETVLREVTERRRAEEELRQNRDHLEEIVTERTKELKDANEDLKHTTEALARSNAELQQFAYIASHDLQEPLRMVASYVQLLQHRYQGRLDENADRYIGFAVEGAKRMQQLILDLLEYARLDTRAKPFTSVDCNEVIHRALKNLEISISETSAVIAIDSPLPTLYGDDTQLTQLFQNLIGNALKFRKPDFAPNITVTATQDNTDWHFTVTDNGIGIDPRFADRIFVIFQRLHPSNEYPGTGIGLAVCKKIVSRHGGNIWLESNPNQGAAFHFTLPAKIPETGL